MQLIVLDIETNIHTGYPVVITVSPPDPEGPVLIRPSDTADLALLVEHLSGPDILLVGHNIAFDLATLQTHLPVLRDSIWSLYKRGRVSDTMVREKLIRCAQGTLSDEDEFDVQGDGYSLEALTNKYLQQSMDKSSGSWRMRFHELESLPTSEWPPSAVAYCIGDVSHPRTIWHKQLEQDPRLLLFPRSPQGGESDNPNPTLDPRLSTGLLLNETQQCRAALALQLMSQGGISTDPRAVAELEGAWTREVAEGRQLASRYFTPAKHSATKTMFDVPPLDPTKCLERLRADVADEYTRLNLPVPRTDPSPRNLQGVVKTDEDTLSVCTSPAIKALADMTSTSKLLTSFLPVLQAGTTSPLHPSYDILKATGRTSCFKPNVQQLPRKGGVRECFVPRPGYVFIECLVPGTRILTADLRWVPIESIQKGQKLVGFDESLGFRRSKFQKATVLNNERVVKPCYRITTDRGVVTASENHSWVTRRDKDLPAEHRSYRGTRCWMKTKDMRAGDRISFFCDPWEFDGSYEGGWLSGMFDGEGWVSGSDGASGIGIAQNDGPIYDRLVRDFTDRGFALDIRKAKIGTCNKIRFEGEKAILRVLGTYRPQRLLNNAGDRCWAGKSTWGNKSKPATVLSVEYVGEQEVLALQTDTKTFVAEGFLSHNCDYSQIELCALAQAQLYLLGRSSMADAIRQGKDLHLVTASVLLGLPYDTVARTYKTDPKVKEARQLSKAANFGYPGGMGPDKFVKYARVGYGLTLTVEQSQQLKQAWLRAYPEQKLYFAHISRQLACGGGDKFDLVQLVSGRIRGQCGFCDGSNSYFQGLAADGAKHALYLVALEAYSMPESPLYGCIGGAFIHDEIILEDPESKASQAAKRLGYLMVKAMEQYIPDVPIKAEPLIMRRLYKAAEPTFGPDGELIPWEPS
jgi:hypothetical protein